MEPLSVAASITGLFTASLEIGKLLSAVITAYEYAQTVYNEIHHFRFVLFRLDKYIHSASMNFARASMIDLDQVVTVLMGCVCTFSELEREVKRLASWTEGLIRRMRWAMAKPGLVDLVQRLQNHKGTICSMLLIFTCESHDEALGGMHELQREVAELVQINGKMMAKLELGSVTAGYDSSSGASIAGSFRTARSVFSFSSARTNFASTLNNSRVYRRALLGRVNKPGPATGQSSALSIQQPWSVLSGVSLSEVSNYAVYSLPISAQELYNPTWYTAPSLIVSLEPSMGAAAPTFLATAFVEALKIARKQKDVDIVKTLANYIPWNIALEMSAVYQRPTPDTSISIGGEPDSLALFALWLRCGGDIEARDSMGKTALHSAVAVGHKDVVEILLSHGAAIDAKNSKGKTALHSAVAFGHKKVVEILLSYGAATEAKDSKGKTALHSAVAGGHKNIVEILLSHGAAIEAKDSNGKTALHFAAAGGQKDAVEILLSHGAAIEANDKLGMTALNSAAARGHKNVVEILLSHGADIRTEDADE